VLNCCSCWREAGRCILYGFIRGGETTQNGHKENICAVQILLMSLFLVAERKLCIFLIWHNHSFLPTRDSKNILEFLMGSNLSKNIYWLKDGNLKIKNMWMWGERWRGSRGNYLLIGPIRLISIFLLIAASPRAGPCARSFRGDSRRRKTSMSDLLFITSLWTEVAHRKLNKCRKEVSQRW